MKKNTAYVVSAFLHTLPRKGDRETLRSTGTELWYYDMWIARHVEGGLEIQLLQWDSPSTIEKLNALPGVHVYHKHKQLYCNGQVWDGNPLRITATKGTL